MMTTGLFCTAAQRQQSKNSFTSHRRSEQIGTVSTRSYLFSYRSPEIIISICKIQPFSEILRMNESSVQVYSYTCLPCIFLFNNLLFSTFKRFFLVYQSCASSAHQNIHCEPFFTFNLQINPVF